MDLDAVAHGLAGAVGGVVAIGAFFPLEVLRTRLQAGDPAVAPALATGRRALSLRSAMVRLVRTEGVWALYQGFNAVLITVGVTNFVYFCMYNLLKEVFTEGIAIASPLVHLAWGGLAGTVTVLVTTPLWLVNTRMKVQQTAAVVKVGWVRPSPAASDQHPTSSAAADPGGDDKLGISAKQAVPYKNLLDGLIRVCREEGPSTLWDGTMPSLILVANPAIQWATYEALKEQLLVRHRGTEILRMEFFVLAALAKTVATVATYPLQVAQTRLRYNHGVHSGQMRCAKDANRKGSQNGAKRYAGTLDCLLRLHCEHGVLGWFHGLSAKMLQTVLTSAFHILCYEEILHIFIAALSPDRHMKPPADL